MTAPFFPPPTDFSPTARLTDAGLVLGEIVLAPMTRRAGGAAELAIAGHEAEIFALLSLAQGRAIHRNVLHGLRGVAKAISYGDNVGAAIRLAQLGLPPLRGPRDAEMLKTGATFLAKGVSPWLILHEAGIEGANVQLFKADWDESLHPRDSAGRFATTSASADQNGRENANKPDHRGPWSAAVDSVSEWLQAPVPEYDQDTGEQVGTRPRWRAIVTNPIVVGAAGAAALLGGEALLAPAATEAAIAAAGRGPVLNPSDFSGKTAAEIDRLAQEIGLVPKGPSPTTGQGAYIDPITGEQRVLIHAEGENPHIHVNDPTGARLDIDGNLVPPESPRAHLPLGGD